MTYVEICSPNQSIDRTFKIVFNFPEIEKVKKRKPLKLYLNPIILAQEWDKSLINGEYSSQADLARKKNISRARVTQVLNLLKFDSNIIKNIKAFGDPLTSKVVTERKLRQITNLSIDKQRALVDKLLNEVKNSTNRD